MNYSAIEYNANNKSIDIYLSGCNGNPKCSGCHNPELFDFNTGNPVSNEVRKTIIRYLQDYDEIINKIMIFGGEPLDQNREEFIEFLQNLRTLPKIEIWIFTRYEFHEIPESIKLLCDYIKTGRFDENLKTENNFQYGIKLATSNQKIYRLKEISLQEYNQILKSGMMWEIYPKCVGSYEIDKEIIKQKSFL